ncbi:hypothetical protein [Fodinibius salsisoli]|uniref:ATP-binding protein n=1 Tax=Fodinibius salsisoli TaxID=2820877 RepID=A0ABT3PK24_9BACT|nr:hypothetical protein [Fodinibius salsisoli]MCW9706277.1 hypothetical protein [Fodinibius salsisoli]
MDQNLVRYSRAGDVFHYRWAARRCLKMIHPKSPIECVYIEGSEENDRKGEYVIDVAEYYKKSDQGRAVGYFQLKHSTKRVDKVFQLSELKKTVEGFAQRFKSLKNDEDIESVEFSIITNRPINERFKKAVEDIINRNSPHQTFVKTLKRYTDFDNGELRDFCKHLHLVDGEGDYNIQKHELSFEVGKFIVGVVDSTIINSIEALVQEKVLPDNEGKIVRVDVLKRFGVSSEKELFPAPSMLDVPEHLIVREQHDQLKKFILKNLSPKIIHASGGVGKSVISVQLAESLPSGSLGIIYDCFGAGKYRNRSHSRHRHLDGLIQIANEIAAEGLCEPLIPQPNSSDDVSLIRTFLRRLDKASTELRKINDDAILSIFIDAADNAEMAAKEFAESCFVNQLLREDVPEGCRIIALCRTERKHLLNPSSIVEECQLKPFNENETSVHLSQYYPEATADEAREFHRLTGGNPRVQANALDFELDSVTELLESIGPSTSTVEDQISAQLDSAVERLRDNLTGDYQEQIDSICIGLANLPPLIPLEILAAATDVQESEVKSFVADLGRPLWISDNSVQFRDENTETWFREKYSATADQIESFVENIKPLARDYTYVAEALPSLLLKAEKYQKLIDLALSEELLPENNPIDERNVRLYRLQFAFKAALQKNKIADAAQIAFRAGEEVASDDRQFNILQGNTDLMAALQSKQKVQEVAYKRDLKGQWDGSENLYSATLLSYSEDFKGEARAFIRAAHRWLELYFEEREEAEEHENDKLSKIDILEFIISYYNLFGPEETVSFIHSWKPPQTIFNITSLFVRRLIDHGKIETVFKLAPLGNRLGNRSPYFIIAIVHELLKIGRFLQAEVIEDCLTWMIHRRTRPSRDFRSWGTEPLRDAIISFAEACANQGLEEKKILRILKYFVPNRASNSISSNHQTGGRSFFLRGHSLKCVLSNNLNPDLEQYMPKSLIDDERNRHTNRDRRNFDEVIGGLFPWYLLRARNITENLEDFEEEYSKTAKASSNATSNRWRQNDNLPYEITRIQFELLKFYQESDSFLINSFKEKLSQEEASYWLKDKLKALRTAYRLEHLKDLRHQLEQSCYQEIETVSDADTETVAEWYVELSRAVLNVSPADSAEYFNLAIEAVSKFGYEIIDRWEALVAVANRRAQENDQIPKTAYRFIRVAELVGNNVAREKHFHRNGAIRTCAKLSPCSALSALSRWRDRRVGWFDRQVRPLADELVRSDVINPTVGWSLSAFSFEYGYLDFAALCLQKGNDERQQQYIFDTAYRDLRLGGSNFGAYQKLKEAIQDLQIKERDLDQVLELTKEEDQVTGSSNRSYNKSESSEIDWDNVFRGLDIVTKSGILKAKEQFDSISQNQFLSVEYFWDELIQRIPDTKAKKALELIVNIDELSIYEIKDILSQIPIRWRQKISVKKAWPNIIESIGRRFSHQLTTQGGRNYFLNQVSLDIDDISSLYEGIIKGLSGSSAFLGSDGFFGFAEIASSFISTEEASDILDFSLSRFELHIEEVFGDGSWADSLKPPTDVTDAFTGFVWAALGEPRSSKRWEAVHCVRRLAESNCKSEINSLLKWLEKGTVDSFGSEKFPFYDLHAKQYLLIALSRIAIDNPEILKDESDLLVNLALNTQHILIQKYAAEIALSLAAAFPDIYDAGLIDQLKKVGKSQLSVRDLEGLDDRVDSPWHEEESIDESLEFYFPHDFKRSWLDALGRAFGINMEQVADLAKEIVFNEWDLEIEDKSIKDPRHNLWNSHHSGRETTHFKSSYPETDNYRFYISYHAMLVVASKLLEEMPTANRRNWEEETWENWLERHTLTRKDGKWLSDRRDPFPIKRRSWVNCKEKRNEWVNGIGPNDFLNTLFFDDIKKSWLNVYGSWNEYNNYKNERIRISSAFVSIEGAESLLIALNNCENASDFKIPSYDEAGFEFDDYPFELFGWIYDEHKSLGIDKFDPSYNIGKSYVNRFNLSHDSAKREWFQTKSSKSALDCRIWSLKKQHGRDELNIGGLKMSCSFQFIKQMCEALNKKLIIEVQINRSLNEPGRQSGTYTRESKVYILSEEGELRDTETSYQLG